MFVSNDDNDLEADVNQCKARTAAGTRCSSQVKPPSRSFCGRHQNALERGTEVFSAETGRKFPRPR